MNLILDTDIGNDVDDVLALGVIHALQARGECRLLAVTVCKGNPLAAAFADAVNTFYGHGDVPVGLVRNGPTPEPGRFLALANAADNGIPRYPRGLRDGAEAPEAVTLLRHVLAGQPDGRATIVGIGFATNLARLLDSPPDHDCPLTGRALVRAKVRLLSLMAGAFAPIGGQTYREYNVVTDIPSAQRLVASWPTPIVFSGYEVGLAIPYPAESIERDFGYVPHHPLAEAYRLYNPPPHCRPTWDLTSVLDAIRPDRGYFGSSPPGRVEVLDDGATRFQPAPDGPHRFLTVTPDQATRTAEALVHLASRPPTRGRNS